MRLAFRIAIKFLTSNKGQTILIALGIGIGISVQIFIGSLIQGLQIDLVDATIGRSSHITLKSTDKNEAIDSFLAIENQLSQDFTELTAISPTVSIGGFLTYEDASEQILFRGFDLKQANDIYVFDEALTEGKMPEKGQVLLGSLLYKENDIKLNDKINILTAEGAITEVEVAGVIDLKVAAINGSWVVGDLELAQEVFNLESDQITAIEMQIIEPFNASETAQLMADTLDNSAVTFSNWKEANEQLLSGLTGQSSSSLIIQIFVVISVVLGISSVLAITVLQKSKQIGILKAMGINDRNASLVFLFQGVLLGIIGGIIGIILGIGLLWSFTTFALNPDGTPVIPIYINLSFIGLSGFIAIAASTIASIIPALKSKKLSPIEVIRNG